jgi:protoporphyrinogen oxidase
MTDYHWVYLLDEHYRVNRVSEQKNVSPHMVPSDRTVLCVELSLWKDEPLWKQSDEEIYRLALRDVMKMGYGVTEGEVEDYFVTDIPTAYPVFLNNSMDDNVLLGMKVGDQIAANGFDAQGWLSEMLAFMNLRFQGK